MSTDNLLIVTRDGWRQLRGGVLTEVAPWPVLDAPATVVTDFDESSVGSYRFDAGKPAYAAALIEKRARAEGLTDGAAHVIVHRTRAVQGGLQTFHTVVPLELWQRTIQWASQQADHCIVLPLGALLSAGVGRGHARVVRAGRTLHFFGESKAGLFYQGTNTMGRSADDLQAAVRVLSGQTRAAIASGIVHPVEWGSLWVADPEQDVRAVEQWTSLADVPAVSLPVAPVDTGATAAPGLVRRAGLRASVNPPVAKLAWWSERLVPGIAALTGVLAVGLAVLGFAVQGEARATRAGAAESQREAAALEARIAAVNSAAMPQDFAPVADMARKLGEGARYDPVAMLALLRDSVDPGTRILRLRLESGVSGSTEPAFQVDGVADTGNVASIGSLLTRLRTAGWSAQPVNTLDAAPGAFSYRLTAAPGVRG
ncbi:hypothetical protein [Acidovorax sp. Leaf160]|uniref:hypothetical protein n=1 Tax=Acidovorax sp. Leaf160 TaxID=1736280 RepID=UPI0007022B1D|nr:hypothetical protein [Acidovorax sp. Leaf160]KQR63015.1 hypothetical protein ASF94_00195 [Acidovorax sp. Leaf160]